MQQYKILRAYAIAGVCTFAPLVVLGQTSSDFDNSQPASSDQQPTLRAESPIKATVAPLPACAPSFEREAPITSPQYPQPYTQSTAGFAPSGYQYNEQPEYGYNSQLPYGSPMYAPRAQQTPYASTSGNYYHGSVGYAPQGLVLPIDLRTAISTLVAKVGDYIEATINQNVSLGGTSYIPAGSVVSGEISEAEAGRRLSRSGSLSIKFDQLRLPSGQTVPISGHLLGTIGKYKEGENGEMRGEKWTAKLGQFALRGVLGAGLGAGLGTGVGAIAGGGYGAGMGAWSGAAIGGGIGGLDMLLRKGRDVIIPSGTQMRLQLDEPLTLPPAPYAGSSPYRAQ